MTPALRHNKDESIKEALENLAKSYGLKITQPKLTGLFSYKFDFKIGVSFRSLYVIGNDTATPLAPITQTKWVASSEVMNVVGGIEARKMMLKKILDKPETLWSGSFFIY